ncbi:FtsH protease activity modulator HflK [Rhodohalobacter sulfatireducens]|uniref:Protein HflK n=1 Tax=Rhodohalobacter sulfatireducens TaxID=2911366 RepID=A0ABS9KED0_9BACT|nr:FtsH protease activity modulator HflK [Rhodohalobacter sulfatireducens]MCG2589212.1 FtsH protease activity modulator HflK [Rhodohalobacter sulfatireducens]
MEELNNPLKGTNIPPQLQKLLGNFKLISVVIAVAIVTFLSFYTVDPEEVGVVQRFGEYQRIAEPGLNFKIPFMETAQIVPVERQLKQEFGYRTVESGIQSQYRKAGFAGESLMLTGDLNLADVEWVVQYRISDPYKYLFKVRNPDNTLRDMSEAAMREVVGNRTVNEVLTIGRASVAARVQAILQEMNTEYETGVQVEQVVLQDINPPDPVKPSFNAVNEAQQQRETLINQARSDYNRVIPRARGVAEQSIQQAEGYATNRTNTALGEVAAFNDLFTEYVRAPQVTKRRIYYETMQELLPKIGNKVITDQDGANVLPLLQMQMNGANLLNQNENNNSNNE